ncbi:hypothetical protein, partial [Stutzerimonas stutzeri]|uniref:hypothetical protein n=1 Tax=Stutzerimonas stutzeri TaxID=316 RepID=UPI002108A0E1
PLGKLDDLSFGLCDLALGLDEHQFFLLFHVFSSGFCLARRPDASAEGFVSCVIPNSTSRLTASGLVGRSSCSLRQLSMASSKVA